MHRWLSFKRSIGDYVLREVCIVLSLMHKTLRDWVFCGPQNKGYMYIIFLGIGIELPDPNAEAFWFHSRGLQNSLSVRHESFSHLLLMLIVLQTCDRDFFFFFKKVLTIVMEIRETFWMKAIYIITRYTYGANHDR